ncbi:hypothetical protein [Halocella sp. SP3-1]|uniref:hypothetical protein n=1 Tax=Halocella sp. SP3-1 TaxID=2382161 RepID=UPI000F759146|nr:hypothetical protein [Halocella sp. SP3-1]AZO96178.1 hypothetical protein D7D81_17140 [Halocella sp. SP3-1]
MDNGIGTGLLFILIVGGCVVHGLITKQMYWDRKEKQFKMKNSPAGRTAERLHKHSTKIISNGRVIGK